MDPNTFPTKGNLILAKNSLALAKQGYVLMDKKRNILIRELMGLIQQAEAIQKEIDRTEHATIGGTPEVQKLLEEKLQYKHFTGPGKSLI